MDNQSLSHTPFTSRKISDFPAEIHGRRKFICGETRKNIMALLFMIVLLFMMSCTNPAVDNSYSSEETFRVKYYEYSGDNGQDYTYTEETVSKERLSEDSTQLLNDKYGVTVDRVWYEGKRICVDIASRTHPVLPFDTNDLTAEIFTNSIVHTFLSYPDVTEVELLFNGTRNVWGQHFTFGIFNSSGELMDPPWDNKTSSGESFQVNYYVYYNDDDRTCTYTKETISKENISEESVRLIKDKYGVDVNKVWYEGGRICVDIVKTSPFPFDMGSYAGSTLTASFVHTFLTYPDCTEVELLVNGHKNVWGHHFAFGVFNSSGGATEPSSDSQDCIDSL